jgi:hypothetical protein
MRVILTEMLDVVHDLRARMGNVLNFGQDFDHTPQAESFIEQKKFIMQVGNNGWKTGGSSSAS